MNDDTDLELWTRLQDEAAFARLVARHAGMVRSACRRQLGRDEAADEAMHAVFIILSRRAGDIIPASQLGAWLCGTARKVCLNAHRSAARRLRHEQEAAQSAAIVMPTADAEPDWEIIRPFLDEAISSLDAKQRVALVGHYLEGRSQAEIAQCMGISENAVQKRIGHAVDRLRTWFGRRGLVVGSVLLCAGLRSEASAIESGLVHGITQAAIHPPVAGAAMVLAGSTSLAGGVSAGVMLAIAGSMLALGAGLSWVLLRPDGAAAAPPPASVPAPRPPPPSALDPALTTHDLFLSADLTGWKIDRGEWSLRKGILRGESTAERGARISSPTAFTELDLTCRVRVAGGAAKQAEIQVGDYAAYVIIPDTGGKWSAIHLRQHAGTVSCTIDGVEQPVQAGANEATGLSGPLSFYISNLEGVVEVADAKYRIPAAPGPGF